MATLVCALGLSLALSTPARAGQYDLRQCYGGNDNSSQMTFNTFDGRYVGSPTDGTCLDLGTTVGVVIDWQSGDDNPSPSSANYSISAPSGTSFTSLSWEQKLTGQGGGTRCVYATDAAAGLIGTSDCITNSFTYYDGPWSGRSHSINTSSIFFSAGCLAGTCNGGAFNILNGFFREISASIADSAAPSLSSGSGLWAQGGWVRGSWSLGWSASDGMGIKTTAWDINGTRQGLGSLLCNPSFTPEGVFYGTLQDGCPSPSTASFTVPTSSYADGSHTLTIHSYDLTSNDGSASKTINVDNSAPSTPSLSGPPQYTNDDTPTFAFSSSDAQSGVAGYECSLDGGGYFACSSAYTTAPLSDGSHSFCVKAKNNSLDSSGNPAFSDPECIVFATSTVPPTASFASQPANPTNAATLDYVVQFSAGVSGLETSDFTVGGTSTGCTSSVSGADDSWTFSLAGCSEGTVTVSLNQDSITDAYGNVGPAAPVGASSVLIDRTRPTAYWTEPESPVTTTTMDYTLVFYEPVSGIASGDFSYTGTATGCVITPSSPSGLAVTVTVTGCSNGTFTLRLNSNTVTDAAGNVGPSSARVASPVTIDHDGPEGTWTSLSSPTNAATLDYTLDLDEPTTSISDSDFEVLGTATGCSVAVTGSSGASFPVSVTGCSEGTVTLRLKAGTLTDALGNTGPAANQDAPTITIDRTDPTVTSWTTPPSPQSSLPITYALDFSESVGVLTSGDFQNLGTAEGCTITPSAPTGSSFTVSIADCGPGTVQLRLAAGSVTDTAGNTGPASESDSGAITYGVPLTNTAAPVISGTLQSGASLQGSDGSWTGSEPIDFAYKWMRCDAADPSSCVDIAGAINSSYSPVAADVGSRLKLSVTATNIIGSLEETSIASSVVGLPKLSFTRQPAWPSKDVVYEWSPVSGAAVTCKLDDGAWESCVSPYSPPSNLPDGEHAFSVRQSLAGQESEIKTTTFKLDRTAPSAPAVIEYPQAKTTLTAISMQFTGEEEASFECRLDGSEWALCSSPFTRSGLGLGSHLFEVRQTDAAGNTGPAASISWEIVTDGGGGDETGAKVITPGSSRITLGSGSSMTLGCGTSSGAFTVCSATSYVLRRGKSGKMRRVWVGKSQVENTRQLGSVAVKIKLNKSGRRLLARSNGPLKVRTKLQVQLSSGRVIKGYAVSWLMPPRQLVVPSGGMFAYGSAALSSRGRTYLGYLVKKLPARTKRISCLGFTDSIGSSVYNYQLGLRRAQSVCRYIKARGIKSSYRSKSYGESRPRASNNTARGRALNRRVEISIIYR